MTPPFLFFSTSGLADPKDLEIWAQILEQMRVYGTPLQENTETFFASIKSYRFSGTLLNFWTLNASTFKRTRAHCQRHPNDSYGLCQVLDGKGELVLHRKKTTLQKGMIFLINSNDPFLLSETQDLKLRSLQIPGGLIRNNIPVPDSFAGTPLPRTSDWVGALETALDTLTLERLAWAQCSTRPLLDHICCLLSLATDPRQHPLKHTTASLLNRFRHTLQENAHKEDFCPTQLAREHHLSLRTVHATFAEAQTSFRKEITALRLERAMHLLSDPKFDTRTTSEIGRLVGFHDGKQLAAHFAKKYHVTPTIFRTMQRKGPRP